MNGPMHERFADTTIALNRKQRMTVAVERVEGYRMTFELD